MRTRVQYLIALPLILICVSLSSGQVQAKAYQGGGNFPFGAVQTNDPTIGALMTTPQGDLMAVAVERNAGGTITGLTGVLFWGIDGTRITLFLGEDGMPAQAMMDGVLVEYDNFSDRSVDLTIVSPNGSVERYPNVPIDPKILSLARQFSSLISRTPHATLPKKNSHAVAYSNVLAPTGRLALVSQEMTVEVILRGLQLVTSGAATYLSIGTCVTLAQAVPASILATGPGAVVVIISAGAACASAGLSAKDVLNQIAGVIVGQLAPEQVELTNAEMASIFASTIGDGVAWGIEKSPGSASAAGITVTIINTLTTELNDQYISDLRAQEQFRRNRAQAEARDEEIDKDGLIGPEDHCPKRAGTLADHGCPKIHEGKWQADWRGGACRKWPDTVHNITPGKTFERVGQPISPVIKDGGFESALSDFAPPNPGVTGRITWTILHSDKTVGAVYDKNGQFICSVILTRVGDLEVTEWVLIEDRNVAEQNCANMDITISASDTQFTLQEKYKGPDKKPLLEHIVLKWNKPYIEENTFKIDLSANESDYRNMELVAYYKNARGANIVPRERVDTRGPQPNTITVTIPIHPKQHKYEIMVSWLHRHPFFGTLGCKFKTRDIHRYVFERPPE